MADPFVFTAQTNILQALEMDERVRDTLRSIGLKCAGKRGDPDEWCVASEVETLADASRYHDVPLEKILAALNDLKIIPAPPAPEGAA